MLLTGIGMISPVVWVLKTLGLRRRALGGVRVGERSRMHARLTALCGALAMVTFACAASEQPTAKNETGTPTESERAPDAVGPKDPGAGEERPEKPGAPPEDPTPPAKPPLAGACGVPLETKPLRIEIVSAHIGPGTADGIQWDSWDPVPSGVSSELDKLFQPSAEDWKTRLTKFVAKMVQAAISPPDPRGAAWIDRGDGQAWVEERTLLNDKQTFTPTWMQPAIWRSVTLNERTLIGFRLEDADFSDHDPMKPFTLNACDLQAAVGEAGHVTEISVGKQTSGEVLSVGVIAIRE
jgi:hypothetical protein